MFKSIPIHTSLLLHFVVIIEWVPSLVVVSVGAIYEATFYNLTTWFHACDNKLLGLFPLLNMFVLNGGQKLVYHLHLAFKFVIKALVQVRWRWDVMLRWSNMEKVGSNNLVRITSNFGHNSQTSSFMAVISPSSCSSNFKVPCVGETVENLSVRLIQWSLIGVQLFSSVNSKHVLMATFTKLNLTHRLNMMPQSCWLARHVHFPKQGIIIVFSHVG